MKALGVNGVRFLKFFHLLFAIMWIGGAFCMVMLLLNTIPTESHEMYMYSLILKKIDDWLIIIGANGCAFTGIIYSIWSKWGFFRHSWIVAKWILTIFMMASGTFIMGPCVNGNVYAIDELSKYTLYNTLFWDNIQKIKYWGIIQISLLVVTIIISIYKPKIKRKS